MRSLFRSLSRGLLASCAVLAAGRGALAQDAPSFQVIPAPREEPPEAAVPAPPARVTNEQRPFVHLLDPSTPSRGALGFEYGLGLAPGVAADRPLPATLVAPSSAGELAGVQHSLSLGYGVTDRIAPFLVARLQPSGEGATAGGAVGSRFQLTAPGSLFRVTLVGAVLREGQGSLGAYARLAASYDLGRLRLAGNLHAEKVFREGRDPVDVLVMAGASYRTLDVMRVGVEYVGQDIEEVGESGPNAEGGARHYAGPTVGFDLGGGRLQLVGGPAFDLSQPTPRLLGRISLLSSF